MKRTEAAFGLLIWLKTLCTTYRVGKDAWINAADEKNIIVHTKFSTAPFFNITELLWIASKPQQDIQVRLKPLFRLDGMNVRLTIAPVPQQDCNDYLAIIGRNKPFVPLWRRDETQFLSVTWLHGHDVSNAVAQHWLMLMAKKRNSLRGEHV